MTVEPAWRCLIFLIVISGAIDLVVASVNIRGVHGGVNKKTGERPARQDIIKFQTSGAAFDLYLLAFKEFQEESRDGLLSYFQIAGIHGYPYVAWDGVEGSQEAGYCLHGSTLFPLWHRPYMALFEQIIWEKAQKIASSYPEAERQKYVSAAKTLRLPFWDWASDPEMPECVVTPEIEVNTPSGRRTIPNPLYSYELNPTVESGFPERSLLTRYPTTVRSPDRRGRTQIEKSQRALRSIGSALRINTYELLTSETNYTVFSTASLEDRGEDYNSVEAIHDAVHGATGGYAGHMAYIPWASFDPIFWLHHTQIDRLVALWQVLHPDSFVEPLPNHSGDFVKPPGALEDSNTPLAPFHINDGKLHNAQTVRHIKEFGYTYPEIQDWDVDPEELKKRVRQQINDLYNKPSSRSMHGKKRSHYDHHHHRRKQEKRGVLPLNLDTAITHILDDAFDLVQSIGNLGQKSLEQFADLGINNLEKQYVINVKVDSAAYPSPFKIHFFLSKPPSDEGLDPVSWSTATNLIGTVGGYSTTSTMPAMEGNGSHVLFAQVPLSHALATLRSMDLISSLKPDVVIPVLEKYLEWRIVTLDGKIIDTEDFMKHDQTGEPLEVKVAGRDVNPLGAVRNIFPRFGEWKVFAEATKGKVGGYSGEK
ncbi:hypothetical protein VTO42DRAFT_874 [Malbranchea cinnamomea]